jgi:hypothetical protein
LKPSTDNLKRQKRNRIPDLWVRLLLSLIFLSVLVTIIYVFVDYYRKYSNVHWEIVLGSLLFFFFFILSFPWRLLKGGGS